MKRSVSGAAVAALALSVSVLVAPAGAADKNLGPVRTISGASSKIDQITDLGVGPDGTAYAPSAYWDQAFAYGPSLGPNATPTRTVGGGGNTLINTPSAIAVDPQGRFWTQTSGGSPYSIGLFAANANGNVSPLKTIGGSNTGLSQVGAIAVGPNGDVYVTDVATDSIVVFDSQAGGNVLPKRVISGVSTLMTSVSDIEVDSAGTVYAVEPSFGWVLAFAPGAQGNVAPTRVISGPTTTLSNPVSLAVDSGRNLYVSDSDDIAIAVFSPSANGNVAPTTRLVGASTLLGSVGAIDVGIDRRVYVIDSVNDSIRVFPALFPFQKQGVVRSLKVSGVKSSARRVISWAAPAANLNAAALTGYKVVIKKGAKVVLSTTTSPSRRAVTVLRKKLKAGTFKVTVAALNKQGLGALTTKTFKVS